MSGKVNIAAAMMGEIVSKLDTSGHEQLEYIDIDLLDSDPNNFYELSGIEALAANIQLCGLLQPIRIRAVEGGRFCVSAGHRRCAALRQLVAEGHVSFREIPAIVEREDASPAAQELRLIFANADNRELTAAEIATQAERVEYLLYQLKEEGVEFPGRMRDQVAAACNVSTSKLARLKVIREGLIPEYHALFMQDKLPEQTAYTLARFPAEFQQRLRNAVSSTPTGRVMEDLLKRYTDDGWRWEPDLTCPDGKPCRRGDTFLRHDADCAPYDRCGGKTCCLKCSRGTSEYYACDKACSRVKNMKKEKRDEAAEAAEARKKKEQTKLQKEIQACARRLVVAIDAAGLEDSVSIAFNAYRTVYTVAVLRGFAAGEFGSSHFYGNDLDPAHYDNIGAIAKKLRCSADYLLGLRDDLGNMPHEEATPEPTPQEAGPTEAAAAEEEAEGESEDGPSSDIDEGEDLGDDEQFVQTIRWENSGTTPPAGEVIVAYSLTNAGPVYRAAVWDGAKFHEPEKPTKVLTGLAYQRWIRLPREGSQASVLPEREWHRGTEPPPRSCWVVALLDLNGHSLTRQLLYYFRGNYHFDNNCNRLADVVPVAWMELPEMPDWAEAKGDNEDYE